MPSYGASLIDNLDLLREVQQLTNEVLRLTDVDVDKVKVTEHGDKQPAFN